MLRYDEVSRGWARFDEACSGEVGLGVARCGEERCAPAG